MFSKLSRYRHVPDVAVPDARARVVAAKEIRPLPAVTGTFVHTVDAGDRLDQLAFTYYGQPLQYWHICDANPQFLSPLALLDQEPLVTTHFPLTAPAGDPPWATLLETLTAEVGIEEVTVVEDVGLEPQQEVAVHGEVVTWYLDRPARAVQVSHNRLKITTEALAERIRAAGFQVRAPAEVGRLGRQIVIPVAVRG